MFFESSNPLTAMLVTGGPAPHDAVWSGSSLGLARLKGKSVRFRILGLDAF